MQCAKCGSGEVCYSESLYEALLEVRVYKCTICRKTIYKNHDFWTGIELEACGSVQAPDPRRGARL